MTNRPANRMSIAIVLGSFIALAQLAAFAAIAFSAWNDLTSPTSRSARFPFIQFAQVFREELVFPVCGMVAKGNMIQSSAIVALKAVDLRTGRSREIEMRGPISPQGVVANGDRLWCYSPPAIFEFDGTTVVEHLPKYRPARHASSLFVYEGRPALIDRNSAGNHRLLVLVDGDWEERGQVGIPGANRTWVVDGRTGESVLVPRTSADSIGKGSKFVNVHVVATKGQYHLFQTDRNSTQIPSAPELSYRFGFDFVTAAAIDQPVSALSPDNSETDTTGWVQLDSQLSSGWGNSQAILGDELLLANQKEIWRQVRTAGSTPSTKFERVTAVDNPKDGFLNIVSSADNSEAYVLFSDMLNDINLFQLEGEQLQKLPYHIEGMGAGLQRWMVKVVLQGLAVLSAGTLMLVFLAAFWAGGSSYSFGHETVLLATLIRRSMARCLDLSFIFGPLVVHSAWLLRQSTATSNFVELVGSDPVGLLHLWPSAVWACATWTALVISTALWGITPGKSIFGIRVVRSTLRPCGIVAALLRELLLGIDAPQLLTVIPGVLCQLVTENRQRIGDLVAGTVVIDVTRSTATPTV